MRVDELEQREAFSAVLAETLQQGWTRQYCRQVQVSLEPIRDAQVWRIQPLFSALVTAPSSRRVRLWLAESFRYTPVKWRAIPQWMLGTALATNAGLRATSRPCLWVAPNLPTSAAILILPGNRRVRVFDFGTGVCRVMLKAGYEPEPVLNEIRARGDRDGPFPRITSWDPGGRWFEEPIVEGFALPRCPPWKDRTRFEEEALRLLGAHLAATGCSTSAAAHSAALVEQVERLSPGLDAKLGSELASRLPPVLAPLAREASRLGEISVAASHGDFQPGNVLVEDHAGQVLLTDWEHAAVRFDAYDPMVWGLRGRRAAGLDRRIAGFLERGEAGAAARLLPRRIDPEWRRGALSLYLLEELAWIVHDGLSGPRAALSATAEAVIAVAVRLASRWSP